MAPPFACNWTRCVFIWLSIATFTAFFSPPVAAITLRWKRNPEPNVLGYRVCYGALNSPATKVEVGNATNCSFNALAPGKTYYFYVTAYDSTGFESAPSASLTYTIPNPTPPAQTNSLPGAATFVWADTATRGNWRGMYGEDGAVAPGSDFIAPTNCQVNGRFNYPVIWESPTTDQRALQKRTGFNRFAAAWEQTADESMFFFLQFKDTAAHRVSFYFLDFENAGRTQRIEFFDYATGQFLAGTTISNFQAGIYSTWNLQGRVTVRLTKLSGPSAVLSGIFVDPTTVGSAPVHVAGVDSTTAGAWVHKYGTQGRFIATESPNLPPGCLVTLFGASPWVWNPSTTDSAALQNPLTGSGIASTWYSGLFYAKLAFTDAEYHRVSFYFVDFDGANRAQRVEMIDSQSGTVLDSAEITQFQGGLWLRYEVKGNVTIRVTNLSGYNAVLSGIFFDPSGLKF